MPITVFNVKSNRTHDIKLEDGKTVAELKEILGDAGYDVSKALVSVNRYKQNDTLIGQTGTYVLQDGDTVEFKTTECSIPETKQALKELACGTACGGHECKCRREENTVKADGLEIEAIDGGLIIRIAR